ncbi:branched-chain amino acid ABC transporter permease [Vulcanimicrobium alpinum]|uniref:Branched-chain amino acid ABC transporter permease n=1 Tax=Vulcanimicrobium alpinum TaxID=3016050 RepID=A0AAN1XWM3_UNVUL|nr:branched-chain amino acid ABC transporter permease [Vulcanimicrobium alpinum]BDE06722.1 branched-chain amino acid ABC transporter permease [Vulcanimicrobium alpinum]
MTVGRAPGERASTATVLRRIGLGGITGSPAALWVSLVLLVLLLAVPAVLPGYQTLFRSILISVALTYGWNLIGGYTGYVSFGNVAFYGLGTYCAALSQSWLDAHGIGDRNLQLVLGVALACVLNAAFAALVGLPVLRLKGHYFGIATLGLALAITDIVGNLDAFGGTGGLAVKQVDDAHFAVYYYAAWIVAAGALAATFFIARSKLGYAFVAIRENEDAAAVLGISATRYKIIAWALSAAIAGAAGAVFAPANGFVDPSIAFAEDANVFPIVMCILGGIGTVAGPFIGALILSGVNEILQRFFIKIHSLFFGAMIVLVVLLLPRGLVWLFGLRGGARTWLKSLSVYKA